MRAVVPEISLSANVGSDRSWVWNAAADVSEGEPEAVTLAIRFANSDSTSSLALALRDALVTNTIICRCQPVPRCVPEGAEGERPPLQDL